MFSIYALLFSLHHVCVLDMHTSLWCCASLNACLDDHLLCCVIIVVIYIWLFWCMIKLLTCFTSCLLDRNLLVTLYLSFYYLLYLEGLMCFVQVFQVTSLYVPSASQLLIILKGREILSTFNLYCAFSLVLLIHHILYPYCFCKLLGFVSMCFVGFYGLYYAYAAFFTL